MRCITLVGFPVPAGLNRATLRAVYGAPPTIQFIDLHALVDNDAKTARIEA